MQFSDFFEDFLKRLLGTPQPPYLGACHVHPPPTHQRQRTLVTWNSLMGDRASLRGQMLYMGPSNTSFTAAISPAGEPPSTRSVNGRGLCAARDSDALAKGLFASIVGSDSRLKGRLARLVSLPCVALGDAKCGAALGPLAGPPQPPSRDKETDEQISISTHTVSVPCQQ